MTPVEQATAWVNLTAILLFLVLLGAIIISMVRRVRLYRTAALPIPVLLRALIVFFSALAVIGGEGVLIRALEIELPEGSVERLAYIVQVDVILLGALAYFAKVELFDLDREDKP